MSQSISCIQGSWFQFIPHFNEGFVKLFLWIDYSYDYIILESLNFY